MTAIKTEKPAENGQAQTAEFEGEIREFVRRDVAPWRKRPAEQDTPADNMGNLVQRVAGASMTEIDNVILELQNVREILRKEGERVQREISGYANLSQAAMASMKIIAESMVQWRATLGQPNLPAVPGPGAE